jgi:hypothetical protein
MCVGVLPAKNHRFRKGRDLGAFRMRGLECILDASKVSLTIAIDGKYLAHRSADSFATVLFHMRWQGERDPMVFVCMFLL